VLCCSIERSGPRHRQPVYQWCYDLGRQADGAVLLAPVAVMLQDQLMGPSADTTAVPAAWQVGLGQLQAQQCQQHLSVHQQQPIDNISVLQQLLTSQASGWSRPGVPD